MTHIAARARSDFGIPSSVVTIIPLSTLSTGPYVTESYTTTSQVTATARWDSATANERVLQAQLGKQLDIVLVLDNQTTPVPTYALVSYQTQQYRVLGATANPLLREVRILGQAVDHNVASVTS